MGLKINIGKMKVMRIKQETRKAVRIDGHDIDHEDVDEFTYLGASVCNCKEGDGMKDLRNSLSKAKVVFVRLKRIWSSNNISRRTKLRLYKTLVTPVLLYGVKHENEQGRQQSS